MFEKGAQEVADVKVVSVLAEGTEFVGDFMAKDSTRIDGVIRGDVDVKNSLILGPKGEIYGNIKAKNFFCSGHVLGSITTEVKLEVTDAASIIGDIDTSVLVVDEKAKIQGSCNMHVVVSKEQEEQLKKIKLRKEEKKTVNFQSKEQAAEAQQPVVENTVETYENTTK